MDGTGTFHMLQERAERIAAANPHLATKILGARRVDRRERVKQTPDFVPAINADASLSAPAKLTARKIIAEVCKAWDVRNSYLASPSHERRACAPRFAVYWLLKTRLELSTTVIGRLMGKRDHTTVIHGVRRARTFYAHDPDWRQKYDSVVAALDEESGGTP